MGRRQVDTHMVELKRAESIDLHRREAVCVVVELDADAGQVVPLITNLNCQGSQLRRCPRPPLQRQRDGLLYVLVGIDGHRERQRDGRAVVLERGVTPIAMVLALERFACHPDGGAQTRRDFVTQGSHERKWGVGGDVVGKLKGGNRAVDALEHGGLPHRLANRMQDTKAEAIAQERCRSLAVEGESDRAVERTGEMPAPRERLGVESPSSREIDGE